MTARSILTNDEIFRVLDNEDCSEADDVFSNSENENGLSVDEVKSEFSRSMKNYKTAYFQKFLHLISCVKILHQFTVVSLTQVNSPGKNRHEWAPYRKHASSRISAINIVHTVGGRAYSDKNFTNPLD